VLTEKTFDTGEVVINYAEGPPSGPPMVLLHGSTQRWQFWQFLLPNLTSRWQVYLLDLRGHGKSGRVANQYRLVDYTRDQTSPNDPLHIWALMVAHVF
jgi:pimeloyl-ACP methyl ester carboxylesterase